MPGSAQTIGRRALAARRAWELVAVFGLALGWYLANGRTIGAGDTISNRYLPIALIREHTFTLDSFPFLYDGDEAYWTVRHRGHWVSSYPVTAAVLAVPIYLPTVLAGEPAASPAWERLEKRAAAAVVALSAVIIFATARRLASPWMAVLVTLAYALGSSNASVAAQGLWQHGPTELGLAAALYALVRGRGDERWVGYAGFALAFAAISRPTGVLLGAPLAVYVLARHARALPRFALGAAPVIALHLLYNAHYHGSPSWTQFPLHGWWWRKTSLDVFAGLLVSPGRGLLVYSPIFAFSLAALLAAWRRGGDGLLRALGAGVVLLIALVGHWRSWWGGATFGPRLLCDAVPMLSIALVSWEEVLRARVLIRSFFAAALAVSIGAHAVGAFWDDGSWNAGPEFVDLAPHRLWSWSDNQLVSPVGAALARTIDRALGTPIPADPIEVARLRLQIERDPWTDRAIAALRTIEAEAHDAAAVAELDRLRASRFTPRMPLGWDFGGRLTLVGVDVEPAGDHALTIRFLWRAERTIDRAYFASVHVDGPAGARFQDDHSIEGPGWTTNRWVPGETVAIVRRVVVPEQAPRGEWVMSVGVWCPEDGAVLAFREGWFRRRKRRALLRLRVSPPEPIVAAAAADPS